MKFAVLDDTLTVLDFEKYLSGTEAQIGGYDLIYKNGAPIRPPQKAGYRSYLGCHNNRICQLKRLSQAFAAEQDKKTQQQKQQATVAGVSSRPPLMQPTDGTGTTKKFR